MRFPKLRSRESGYRIFFASDLHGSEKCFGKFLNAAKFYGTDALICGGDLTGKLLVPLVDVGGGRHEVEFMGARRTVPAGPELDELEKAIRFNGFYPHRCEPEELRRMSTDAGYSAAVFGRAMAATVERWVAMAEERLAGTGIRCLIMPGNDDDPEIDALLSSSETVENHDGRLVQLDGLTVAGFAPANPTPFDSARELAEDEIERRLVALLEEAGNPRQVVLNSHVPPYDSRLDSAPELDRDLGVVLKGGQPNMIPVGSTGVRAAIERFTPLLTLHGHVHESRGIAHIGGSVCINPGSDYNQGVLRGALVTVADGRVARHQLVTG